MNQNDNDNCIRTSDKELTTSYINNKNNKNNTSNNNIQKYNT